MDATPTFVVRAPTLDDVQAVVDLINACSLAEGGAPDENPEIIRAGWQASGFDLAQDAWLVVAPGGQLAGYEQVEVADDGSPTELDGYVHPNHTGRGIGTRLLRLAEQRARQAASTPGAIRLRGNIAAANAAARQLFAAEGYRLIRHFWRMEIDFDVPPAAVQQPPGITVRAFAPGDERATYETVEEAFADHWEHVRPTFDDWQRRTIQRADFDPSLWFLALDGEQAVGTLLGYSRGERFGWVRGLGVRRPWRGRGVGMALLNAAFAAFYARGYAGAGLGVDAESLTGATRLYERAGMRVTEQYETYEKNLVRDN